MVDEPWVQTISLFARCPEIRKAPRGEGLRRDLTVSCRDQRQEIWKGVGEESSQRRRQDPPTPTGAPSTSSDGFGQD